jgi:hypothetical protein
MNPEITRKIFQIFNSLLTPASATELAGRCKGPESVPICITSPSNRVHGCPNGARPVPDFDRTRLEATRTFLGRRSYWQWRMFTSRRSSLPHPSRTLAIAAGPIYWACYRQALLDDLPGSNASYSDTGRRYISLCLSVTQSIRAGAYPCKAFPRLGFLVPSRL